MKRAVRGAVAGLAVSIAALLAASTAFAADFIQPITSPEPTQVGPAGMAVGDIDNDGDQDIVTSNVFAAVTSSLVNNGVGDFREVTVGSNAATVDAGLGNFDGDAFLDLVLLYQGTPPATGLLALFHGNGNGSFTFAAGTNAIVATGVRSRTLAVGNFNGDSRSDVAVVNGQNTPASTNGTVMTFLGNPANAPNQPTFSAALPAQTLTTQLNSNDIVFANFNGGATDLAVTNTSSSSVSFLAGNGVGFAAPVNVAAGAAVLYIDAANLNGDANNDLVATINASNPSSVRTLFGNGAGAFPTQATVPAAAAAGTSTPQTVVAKDFDNDGDNDLAVANGSSPNTVSTLNNNGLGAFSIAPTSPETGLGTPGTIPFSLVSADFDGSGFNDLAVSNLFSSPGEIPILDNLSGNQADLSITKADSPDPVPATQNLTYGLTVTNASANTPTSVKATDVLPAGLTFNAGASDPACTAVGQRVTCDYGSVANGTPETLNIVATPTGTVLGPVSNTATVSANLPDPVPANNTSTTTTTVNPAADLSLTKMDSPDPAHVGDDITYTLTAANAGPNPATGVTITDTLPSQVTYNDAASDPSCEETSPGSGVVECNLPGSIASGGNAVVAIHATADSPHVGATGSATVSANEFDPNNANNTAGAVTEIRASADLSIFKAEFGDPTYINDQDFRYRLHVHNAGPSPATGITIVDNLPPEVSYTDGDSDPRCDETSPGVVTCTTTDPLAPGADDTYDIYANPIATASPATNTVSISAAEDDPVPGNNSDSEDTTILPASADLVLDKSGPIGILHQGDSFTYDIGLQNSGPSEFSENVVVTDTLPSELTYNDALSDPRCDETSPGIITCTEPSVDQTTGDAFTIAVTATDVPPSFMVTNSASVTAGSPPDPNGGNNSDSVDTQIRPLSDLALTKSDSADPARVGESFDYTLAVHNGGPSDDSDVNVTDTLPPEVTYNDAASDPRCDETSPGMVFCDEPTGLANGGDTSFTINVTANSPASPATNSAFVLGFSDDNSVANNQATQDTTIVPASDLAITKSDSADPVHVGDSFDYMLGVTNGGPSAATNVTVTDTLPSQVSYNDGASDSRCNETAPGTVTCTEANLAASAGTSFTLNVTADAPAAPATNNASVSADQDDLVPGNDSASQDTTILAVADLSIDKTASADPVQAGDAYTYDLAVDNNGPNDATNLAVTDTLPSEVTYNDGTSDPRCDLTTPPSTVTCTDASLASGAGTSFTIAVTADSPASPAVNNASVAADEADFVPGNNSDSEDTTILPSADLEVVALGESADPVLVGEDFNYMIEIGNNGPQDATNVKTVDLLPPEVTYDDANSDPRCDLTDPQKVTCTEASLPQGVATVFTIAVTANAPASPAVNNVSVTGDQGDPTPGNNSASVDTTILAPAADLEVVALGESADPVLVGEDFDYMIEIGNNGPQDATNVKTIDLLPPEVTYDDANSDPRCDLTDPQKVTCTEASLPQGVATVFTIAVTANAPAHPATNNVSVSGDPPDPNPGNNSASEDTTINAPPGPVAPDLAITKTDAVDPVTVSTDVTYTLAVTNNGTTTATNVKATDTPPFGLIFKAEASSASCGIGTGALVCDFGDVAAGVTETQTLVFTVTTAAFPAVINRASVSGAEPDPTPGNNTDSEETTIALVTPPGGVTPACGPYPATIAGSEGSDTLIGTPGPDVINGFGGNDIVRGLGGNDRVCGAAGNDSLFGGQGNDELYGEAGRDRLVGGPGRDILKGGPG